MSQRFQSTGGVAGPPQSPQQARYQQPMPQPPPGTPMRPYSGPAQNFPVSIFVFIKFRIENIWGNIEVIIVLCFIDCLNYRHSAVSRHRHLK